jgi:hypothetical protein
MVVQSFNQTLQVDGSHGSCSFCGFSNGCIGPPVDMTGETTTRRRKNGRH